MNFLERLLDGATVEWKTLGEVFQMRAGQHISASKIMQTVNDEYIYPCFGGNGVRGFVNKNSHDGAHLLIGRQGALCGNVQRMKGKFYATEHAVVVTASEQVNIDWAFHLLTIMNLNQYASQSAQPGLAVGKLQGLKIPIPPLKIQAEIVRILDTFTELTAELTAELIDRKKQYNYYRDRLLTFEKGEVEWKALGEVCSLISAGGDLPKNFAKGQVDPTDEFPYPIYANATGDNGLYGFTDGYKIESDAVTISARGAKIGYHAVREGKFTTIIRLITLVPNKNVVLTKYLNYILDMTPIGGTDGGIPQLTVPTVKKISIPLPPLADQARIVSILDKFDTLTHSISEGLPREIALRQKQYEYYRDLLLTFPKSEEVEAHLVTVEKSDE